MQKFSVGSDKTSPRGNWPDPEVGTDPSFFNSADFSSWSRGNYFFHAKANSPEALARFMGAFPF